MKHTGSCLCGTVKFEIIGNFEQFYLCHCKYCQKDTGSAHAANLFAPGASLNWLNGETNVQQFELKNSGHIKAFCVTCGSALPNVQMNGKLVVVPAGSLDSDVEKMPDAHIFVNRRAIWDDALEKIPCFDELPE
ncbi:GFA family protein [Fusibacter paucivorans]|jgi:hypothetical protein|uniref:GFA family protein n=1 Tax=Fusibacter paucivorans TaxID=76009 RepID=A0ABS5PJ76_9FIRM|nr:GFA family protein [Fusibacter paucivorans]MBS7525160.1 GFA family protein [Fusibacter paucivorans]MDK2868121.1 hypothetical protein [Clostridiales bacterium]